MHRIELADTLLALVEGITPPSGSGLFITEALLEIPMEITGASQDDRLVFFAAPPHTKWITGVLPPIHKTLLRVEITDHDAGGQA